MIIEKTEVAVVTDLHIGIHQNTQLWHTIATKFAKWFKDQLVERKIKDIIICGDVNDDRNEIDVTSLHVLNRIFNIWKDFNITIVVGNHDAYYKDRADVHSLSLFSGWSNINIIDTVEEVDAFGKKIVFAPWGTDLKDIPKCDILFGHFEINGFNLSKVKTCNKGLGSSNILKKAPFIVSGHFHLREDRKYKNGRILYVGSPYEQNWGDCGTDPRGFYFIDVKTGKRQFVENTISPRHKKVRISEITSAGSVTPEIRKEFPGNFVTLIIDQDLKEEKLDNFITSLNSLCPSVLKIDHYLEERFGVEEVLTEFDSVDIKKSVTDFIDLMEDLNYKEEVKSYMLQLYDDCAK